MENVVYKEIISGLSVTIRYPESGDTKIMCDYINGISKGKLVDDIQMYKNV